LLRLDRVRELVRNEPIAFLRAGREFASAEVDVASRSKGTRAEFLRGRRRVPTRVYLDVRQVGAELRLHARPQITRQCGAATLRDLCDTFGLPRSLALN